MKVIKGKNWTEKKEKNIHKKAKKKKKVHRNAEHTRANVNLEGKNPAESWRVMGQGRNGKYGARSL